MASKVTNAVKEAASEPLLTGALLYILTRGPEHIRARLLAPFQGNVLAKNGVQRLATFITVLKVLTGLNVLRRISQGLNSLAWNNWTLSRPGAAFKFGPEKEELVIITGGSSGFGYEMVKDFSKVARVAVLDIQDFPPELARREFRSISVHLDGILISIKPSSCIDGYV
jgi:all-trans-retinol dehydrogenase (NAD+)